MFLLVILLCFLPFLTFLGYALSKGYFSMDQYKSPIKRFPRRIKISDDGYLKLLRKIYSSSSNNTKKEFDHIEFQRFSAWGSPAYKVIIAASGLVIYEGFQAVRLKGKYKWKISKKDLNALNRQLTHLLLKQDTYDKYSSEISQISKVSIKINKESFSTQFCYDHAAKYPHELSQLETLIDSCAQIKSLWLFWDQHPVCIAVQDDYLSVLELKDDGLYLKNLHKEIRIGVDAASWKNLSTLIEQTNCNYYKESDLHYSTLPNRTMLITIKTGFNYLIEQIAEPEMYALINNYVQKLTKTIPHKERIH